LSGWEETQGYSHRPSVQIVVGIDLGERERAMKRGRKRGREGESEKARKRGRKRESEEEREKVRKRGRKREREGESE
jgi:hypothetical protein